MDSEETLKYLQQKYPEDLMICLRAHSSDPESLVNLLKMYLETCKY